MGSSTTVITPETKTVKQIEPMNKTPECRKTSVDKHNDVLVWRNIITFVYVHLGGLYGLYLMISRWNIALLLFVIGYGFCGGIGITAGAHRLWAHRSYKAKWQLRVLLGIFQTIAFQNHIYEWARDHRVHHKFSETDADPHNAKRGFFFSHIGWLLVKKHPDVKKKGKTVDMSDLEKDFVVVWQRRLYPLLMPILAFFLPTWLQVRLLGVDPWTSWYASLFRWSFSLNCTWLVNSAAHMWGNRPYDRNINAAENIVVSTLAYGEGWHNYHHTFPYDYKAAELGDYSFNYTTGFIDLMARIGWAYDLKSVSEPMIKRRILRSGDGSHKVHGHGATKEEHEHLWGWGDRDIDSIDMIDINISNAKPE